MSPASLGSIPGVQKIFTLMNPYWTSGCTCHTFQTGQLLGQKKKRIKSCLGVYTFFYKNHLKSFEPCWFLRNPISSLGMIHKFLLQKLVSTPPIRDTIGQYTHFFKKPNYKKVGLRRSKLLETVGLHISDPKKLGCWSSKNFKKLQESFRPKMSNILIKFQG